MKYRPTFVSLLFMIIQHLDCTVQTDGQLGEEEASHPENVAVLLGQNITFSCIRGNSSVLSIRYLKYEHDSSSPPRSVQIYRQYDGTTKVLFKNYSVNPLQDKGVQLFANAANTAFAGSYACYYANHHGFVKRAAELVVLESSPVCGITTQDETQTRLLHCAVQFSGHYYPRMEWRLSNGTVISVCDEQSVTDHSAPTLGLSCDVNVTEDEGDYECRMFFTVAGRRNATHNYYFTYSRHVPSYSDSCFIDPERVTAPSASSNERHGRGFDKNFIIILAAIAGVVLVMTAVIVILLLLRNNGCETEKKAVTPDVVAQSSMLDSDLHLARRTVQESAYTGLHRPVGSSQHQPVYAALSPAYEEIPAERALRRAAPSSAYEEIETQSSNDNELSPYPFAIYNRTEVGAWRIESGWRQ